MRFGFRACSVRLAEIPRSLAMVWKLHGRYASVGVWTSIFSGSGVDGKKRGCQCHLILDWSFLKTSIPPGLWVWGILTALTWCLLHQLTVPIIEEQHSLRTKGALRCWHPWISYGNFWLPYQPASNMITRSVNPIEFMIQAARTISLERITPDKAERSWPAKIQQHVPRVERCCWR